MWRRVSQLQMKHTNWLETWMRGSRTVHDAIVIVLIFLLHFVYPIFFMLQPSKLPDRWLFVVVVVVTYSYIQQFFMRLSISSGQFGGASIRIPLSINCKTLFPLIPCEMYNIKMTRGTIKLPHFYLEHNVCAWFNFMTLQLWIHFRPAVSREEMTTQPE